MSIPGIEIFRCYDEHGPIRVFEEGSHRYLAFGDDAHQSCIDMLQPARLNYQYTQAMMLALLYSPEAKHVTLLGLGAGSLVHSFYKYDPSIVLNVVELREKVAATAKEWFALPTHSELRLHIQDACLYMANSPHKSDLILTDIYNNDGMIESQISPAFLKDCFENLTKFGILVLNLWEQGGGIDPQALQRIRDHFGEHNMSCLIEDGNLIVLAFKGGLPQTNNRRIQPIAKQLAKKLDIPILKLLQRLKTV